MSVLTPEQEKIKAAILGSMIQAHQAVSEMITAMQRERVVTPPTEMQLIREIKQREGGRG